MQYWDTSYMQPTFNEIAGLRRGEKGRAGEAAPPSERM